MTEQMLTVEMTMNESLYEELKARPDGPATTTLLIYSDDTWDTFYEHFIPNILREAAWVANDHTTGIELSDVDGFDPGQYDVQGWPTALKLHVLEAAKSNWTPPHRGECGEWTGTAQAAAEMFEKAPALKKTFTRSPEQVPQMWLDRDQGSKRAPTP